MALRLRRGTDAERLLITPEEGELIYATDTKKVYIGDGTTAGGLLFQVGSVQLNDILDVNITVGDSTAPTDGDALLYDSVSGEWRPGAVSTGSVSISLDDVIDVSANGLDGTLPSEGDVLTWNGVQARWEPQAQDTSVVVSLNDLSDVRANLGDSTQPQDGEPLVWNNDQQVWSPGAISLQDLDNVFLGVPTTGDVLRFDGFNWSNSVDSSLASVSEDTSPSLGGNLNLDTYAITGIGDINIDGNIVADQIQASIANPDSSLALDIITSTLNVNNINAGILNTENFESDSVNVNFDGNVRRNYVNIKTNVSTAALGSRVRFQVSNGSIAAPTAVSDGDTLSGISFDGYDGLRYVGSAGILASVDGSLSPYIVPGRLTFYTFNSIGAINAVDLDSSGVLTAPSVNSTFTGDLTGSVFADNSTLLVDAVNGEIPGYVKIDDLKTALQDGAGDYSAFKAWVLANL